jgi:hypothetical protein
LQAALLLPQPGVANVANVHVVLIERKQCATVVRTNIGRVFFDSMLTLKFVPVMGCKICRRFYNFLTLGLDGGGERVNADSSVWCGCAEKHFQERFAELQIPPLRYAPVGMTKETATLPSKVVAG